MYGHLSKSLVRGGQKVKRGQIIALTGDSGLSTGPHLHYEVLKNGVHVDPTAYFFTGRDYREAGILHSKLALKYSSYGNKGFKAFCATEREGDSDNMIWTPEFATYLEDAPWPTTKEELIDYAVRSRGTHRGC